MIFFQRLLAAPLLAIAAALPQAGAAQDEAQSPVATEGEAIVVTGYRRNEVRAHVYEVLDVDAGQLSRREGTFCPRIVNFPADWATIIERDIRANAREAGIEVAPEGCPADAFAIFVREPQPFVKAVQERYPRVFDSLYRTQTKDLLDTPRAVYSWSLEATRDRYGGDLFGDPPQVQGTDISRLTQNVRRDIEGTYLVMDLDETEGMSLRQIADFITLHMLVDMQPDALARSAPDSILRLFEFDNPTDGPEAMSPMDFALIEAIYAQPRNDRSARVQRSRILDHIMHRLKNEGLARN